MTLLLFINWLRDNWTPLMEEYQKGRNGVIDFHKFQAWAQERYDAMVSDDER